MSLVFVANILWSVKCFGKQSGQKTLRLLRFLSAIAFSETNLEDVSFRKYTVARQRGIGQRYKETPRASHFYNSTISIFHILGYLSFFPSKIRNNVCALYSNKKISGIPLSSGRRSLSNAVSIALTILSMSEKKELTRFFIGETPFLFFPFVG